MTQDSAHDQSLAAQLCDIVGSTHVLSSEQVSGRATHFWDPAPMQAKLLVRPADTQQTADVLKACHARGQSVVTHGGLTGLVDGNHCDASDVVMSLERLNTIESVDSIGRTITVQAGVILQQAQQAAQDAGLLLGLDLGARGTCTIGGNLSTNAGGLSVLRYGMAREQVLGLEAVLADGTVVSSMNGMLKNNTGYDLKQLFIGSEGTLGVITRAVLRLRNSTPVVNTGLLAFEHFDQVVKTLQHLDHTLNGSLNAFEILWQPFYALNTDPQHQGSVSAPLARNYPLYAIAESQGTDKQAGVLFQKALEEALSADWLTDAALAQSDKERANIWHIREHIDQALSHDPIFVYDISLPIVHMDNYIKNLLADVQAQWTDALVYVYGHLADGNLHILVVPSAEVSKKKDNTETIDDQTRVNWQRLSNTMVYQPLQAIGGSVSAEHGIGLSKKEYLPLSRNPAELQLMRLLKNTLDPKGLLNRDKILSV